MIVCMHVYDHVLRIYVYAQTLMGMSNHACESPVQATDRHFHFNAATIKHHSSVQTGDRAHV